MVTVNNAATVAITAPTQGARVSGTTVTITVAKSSNVSWENVYIDGAYFASTPPMTFSLELDHRCERVAYHKRNRLFVHFDRLGTAALTVTVAN